jgi:phytoene/squalene synthetase
MNSDFYQIHLNKVSRSFALCIEQLKEPLKGQVGLAYLICRILDTVEDSHFENTAEKIGLITEFEMFIISKPTANQVETWLARILKNNLNNIAAQSSPAYTSDANSEIPLISDGEMLLLKDSFRIFSDLHLLAIKDRQILQDTALSMARGMAYFIQKHSFKNILSLNSLTEVNRYCFFVAGLVGEMLSKLAHLNNPNFNLSEENLKNAHQFGLFLQKINLLKDQIHDEQVGRNLVPSYAELWQSLKQDADGAFAYLAAIPFEDREFRIFSGWSLFLGLASLPFIKKSWALKVFEKIPRLATQTLLNKVTANIDNNEQLKKLFILMSSNIEKLESHESQNNIYHEPHRSEQKFLDNPKPFNDFRNLYHGKLSQSHLVSLGMESQGNSV